jgi:hypothetical protein
VEARPRLLLILAIVLAIRLPFLTQAIQGDDPYYLFGAQHALIDPAHPSHARYIFQGEMVDMRGHPHPPLNAWMLAGLLAIFGDVYEAPFHAAYIVFSAIAAIAMWFLSRRFVEAPIAATMLFVATPAFVVNGNSLESDLPFLAFWMAGIALFVHGRFAWSGAALALAAMTAYQAIIATPVLWAYCWFHARGSRAAWVTALTPVAVVGAYQAYERLTSGALPATVLAGYFSTYGLQAIANKLRNAAALTAHTAWMLFPVLTAVVFRRWWPVGIAAAIGGAFVDPHPLFWVSFALGAMAIAACVHKPDFLRAWILIFFASALALFFAGSARYLLPMAPALAMIASRERRLAAVAIAGNLALGIALAVVNWQHWDGYRDFAESIRREVEQKRVWINGEWGLRFYLESLGGVPLARKDIVQPGEWIVSTQLGYPQPVTAPLAVVAEREIVPSLPLRLIGLGAKSGYSTAAFGYRPFDIDAGPVDRIQAHAVLERKPVLSYLPMSAPEAQTQIASGVYQLEGQTRWMSGRATVLLKAPVNPMPLHVRLYLPEAAPARVVRVLLDGSHVHQERLPGPGIHSLRTGAVSGTAVTIEVDKTFSVPGDFRELGVVLMEVGFRED